MRISFLLGPAGSGKTFRCLAEIRSELANSPEGPPLVLIAPKQATFQLERQLLQPEGLSGYSRLRILSFERWARFILEELDRQPPEFISERGRTMVLRAILNEVHQELCIFKSAARRLGFAEELSGQIREFQNHGLTPNALRQLARQSSGSTEEKLLDLALLFESYNAWLSERNLRDADALLSVAADALTTNDEREFQIGCLWCDGFAQLTPAERELLIAVLPFCSNATFAFCAESEQQLRSPLSPWYLVSRTFHQLKANIETRYSSEAEIRVERLARDPDKNRFQTAPDLRRLERCWACLEDSPRVIGDGSIRAVQCADPEAEATFCAREIVRHVRAGGRYRDVALLLRGFENDYPHVLRRVFRRYEIPMFLDHRENVSHHPMAELTRGALRTVAFNWRHEDWFRTLKSGLVRFRQDYLDTLENESLKRGWEGAVWRDGLRISNEPKLEERLNRWRERLIAPFATFARDLGGHPSARRLAESLRKLWTTLSVEQELENWSQENQALHSTVWEQMNSWLESLELAFGAQTLPLAEWLPVLEAGLAGLTVGVIPPVLDQVLIGAVDRSRNPDLKILFIPGFNERVFPAVPKREWLLSEEDRATLAATGCELARIPGMQIAEEQFYGYIACTRPREKLILTYARSTQDGTVLNPSRFLAQIRRIVPSLETEEWRPPEDLNEFVHRCELAPFSKPGDFQADGYLLSSPEQNEKLDPELAERLYGSELKISVSSLERFASCPFRFFLEYGLRVHERQEFLLDVREKGSFQHVVLAEFHEEVTAEGRSWRQVAKNEARELIGRIADKHRAEFRDGLLEANAQNRFSAEMYKALLQDFIEVVIDWFQTNDFDPERVEFAFGMDSSLPGWRVPLSNGRALVLQGRVDRIDLHRKSDSEALCLIMDYKSGLKKPDRILMHHGIQQQLPAYLLAITRVKEIAAHFQVEKLTPAGCFLLPLSVRVESEQTRTDALQAAEEAKKSAFTHNGIFDMDHLRLLDQLAPEGDSLQFRWSITNDGEPYVNSFNALRREDFANLLAHSEKLIRDFGERIYSGEISIHPFKRGANTACDHCRMQPVCRFDAWTQDYNVLKRTGETRGTNAQ